MEATEATPTVAHHQNRIQAIENQLARLHSRLADLYRRSSRFAQLRLVIFFGGAILVGLLFWFGWSWVWGVIIGLIWLLAFGWAIYQHQQLEAAIIQMQVWQQIKQGQVARYHLNWQAMPPETIGRPKAEHPFARDLDLTGERSLHRLLDTCVSQAGSETLRDWLYERRPNLADIQHRQTLVQTLAPLHLFRHKLRLHGLLANSGYGDWRQGDRLQQWLADTTGNQSLRLILILSLCLTPINWLLFALFMGGILPPYWLISVGVYALLAFLRWQDMTGVFTSGLILQNSLKRLEGVFQHIEGFPMARYPALNQLCQPFRDPEQRPSAQIKRVSRLVAGAGLSQNPALALLLNLAVPWNLFFAHRLTAAKASIAHTMPRWLTVWFELEALSALADFAYLNSDYVFPTVTESLDQPFFKAIDLGHPLLSRAEKVCNDFRLIGQGQVNIITGSNMAGKSSFLRTVGVNLRLAYTGAPVNATTCEVSLFRVFSSLNVTDSVTDGISYFYAEVKRLKALLTELEKDDEIPLFFLIDEIFRGTNNRERYLGSHAYIRALVGQHGSGLIATHDLELVKLADDFAEITNYHFRDDVVDDQMVFDYKLHPGPCPTTNALKIMAIEGLPVSNTPSA